MKNTHFIESLKKINFLKKTKKKDFSWYKNQIKQLFEVHTLPKISVKYKIFLGGFVAGRGLINVNAKKSKGAVFGILVDPEFSITQHSNNFQFLYAFLLLFKTGIFHYNNGTLVFKIGNRKALLEKVVPFFEDYVFPYQSKEQKERIILYKRLLCFFTEKKHKEKKVFVNQILPLWDRMLEQKGQENPGFACLKEAQRFVCEKESSETTRGLITHQTRE